MVALGLGHIDRHLLRCRTGLQIRCDLMTGQFPFKSIPDEMEEASSICGAARHHVGLGIAVPNRRTPLGLCGSSGTPAWTIAQSCGGSILYRTP
jgi:hypothetical protein